MRIRNKKAQKLKTMRKKNSKFRGDQGFTVLSSNELILIARCELRVDINQIPNNWPCQVGR